MIWDMQSLFSWDQAITASAVSTNVIDQGPVGTPISSTVPLRRDLGAGGPVPLRTQITQAFNNLTSLEAILQTSDDEAFGSGVVVVGRSGAVALADLKVGTVLAPNYVPQGAAKRYLRMSYVVVGTAPTTGKVSSGIVTGHQTN